MHTIYSTVELERMSSDDIEPYDWYRRFFGRGRGGFLEDMFRGFDQMRREMERGIRRY